MQLDVLYLILVNRDPRFPTRTVIALENPTTIKENVYQIENRTEYIATCSVSCKIAPKMMSGKSVAEMKPISDCDVGNMMYFIELYHSLIILALNSTYVVK